MDKSSPQLPPKVKVVQFTEDELKAFNSICDAALKHEGVNLAWAVACFIQKFNSVSLTDPPEPAKPE